MTYATTTYELHQRSDGLWAVAERMIDPGIIARLITEYMHREQAEERLAGMKEDKQ